MKWQIPALLALAVGLFGPGPRAMAQESDTPRETFEGNVQVTEVLLDVLVTDKKGNIIVGLDKDDFIVEEDGEAVPLDSLTFYSNRLLETQPEAGPRPALAKNLDEVPRDRFFILLFEDQKAHSVEGLGLLRNQLDAGRQSRRWISSELQPGDWVAVLSYDYKLKIYQDFSQDRAALVQAVERAMKGKDAGNWPSRVDGDGESFSLAASLPQGEVLRDKTKTIYDALQVLAQATSALPARKNLLLFTIGFGDIGTFGQYVPDTRYYGPTMQALNDNNVAVYPIDLVPGGTRHTMSDAMNHLALDTGGEYLFNFTSFITPLRRIAEATSGYYLLSYKARHSADEAGFQRVTVSAKNPEFRIRARTGYSFGGDES
jgi:VWFA-related protein